VDETYMKVKGRWIHLYRAVDSRGQTIDFLLSAKRDVEATKRLLKATAVMKRDGELWRQSPAYEAMAMMRKGQVRNIGGRDIRTQATFIAGLFQVAA
jgi:IS6 family transposase